MMSETHAPTREELEATGELVRLLKDQPYEEVVVTEPPKRSFPTPLPLDDLVANLKKLPNGLQMAIDSEAAMLKRADEVSDPEEIAYLKQMFVYWGRARGRLEAETAAEAQRLNAIRNITDARGTPLETPPPPQTLNPEAIKLIAGIGADLGKFASDMQAIRTILGTSREVLPMLEAICQVAFAGKIKTGEGWRDVCPALHKAQMDEAFRVAREAI